MHIEGTKNNTQKRTDLKYIQSYICQKVNNNKKTQKKQQIKKVHNTKTKTNYHGIETFSES